MFNKYFNLGGNIVEQFKLREILSYPYTNRYRKFYSMIQSFKHVLGPDYTNSEEFIYIKNYYNYLNDRCTIEEVKMYAVINNKFHCISYSNEFNGYYLDSYSLNEIKFTRLKESKKYSDKHIDLSIYFKDESMFNLNNFNDTYDELGVDELGQIILYFYSKLN